MEKWRAPERAEHEHTLAMFPQGDALVETYQKRHGADEHHAEVIKDAAYSYLDKALEHFSLSESLEGMSFPHSTVTLRELAEMVFAAQGGVPLSTSESVASVANPKPSREFLFIGFPNSTSVGGPLEFAEFPLHLLLAKLPKALEDLKQGREVQEYSVTTLGYPTNEYGSLSDQFMQTLAEHPLDALGRGYAQFLDHNFDFKEGERVRITGISTGSSIAAHAASELLKTGAVSQDRGGKPQLSVALYAPVGMAHLNDTSARTAQMTAGFAVEGAKIFAGNVSGARTVMMGQGKYFPAVREALKDRFEPQMDKEQKAKKSRTILTIAQALWKGGELPANVKATEIMGLNDLLVYSRARRRSVRVAAAEQGRERGAQGPLQGKALDRPSESERVFGLDMPHMVPLFRESEFKRLDSVVDAVDNLKNAEPLKRYTVEHGR